MNNSKIIIHKSFILVLSVMNYSLIHYSEISLLRSEMEPVGRLLSDLVLYKMIMRSDREVQSLKFTIRIPNTVIRNSCYYIIYLVGDWRGRITVRNTLYIHTL